MSHILIGFLLTPMYTQVTDESVIGMIEKRKQPPRLPAMVLLETEVDHLEDADVYLSGQLYICYIHLITSLPSPYVHFIIQHNENLTTLQFEYIFNI